MSDAISLKNIFQFFPSTHTGSSESALFVQDSVDEIRQRFQESYELGMIGKGICDELNQVFTECQEKGWDGYQAKPISIRSYLNADRFLKALVPMIEAPSIGAEPDGQITVEWYRNPQWLLSISFDPESKIHYAALCGQNKVFGTESFYDVVPDNILNLIYRVISVKQV